MALETRHATSLIELCSRRGEPASADLQRGLHLARLFETDHSVPLAYRSLAWHVITDSHQAAGWAMPEGERFPVCCGAAASTHHGCALLIQEIAGQVAAVEGPIMLFGAMAASRSLFGSWSVLPVTGAFLVPLNGKGARLPQANVYRGAVGVRWGSAGDLLELFERHSTPVDLAGVDVRIPSVELIAARTAGCLDNPAGLECLIFCGAAYAAVRKGRWREVRRIAPQLGGNQTPLEAAYRLGIDRWLGIEMAPTKRVVLAVRRLLGRRGRAA
jgi:hypothetical protein